MILKHHYQMKLSTYDKVFAQYKICFLLSMTKSCSSFLVNAQVCWNSNESVILKQNGGHSDKYILAFPS